MSSSLSIIGTGVYLTTSRPVSEMVSEAGGEMTGYTDWPNTSMASAEEHPSNMGAEALQQALDDAGLSASKLDYIISAGMSRDYQPSWSLSSEWARLVGAPEQCMPLDLTSGCAGTLYALDLMLGNLTARGGGYAAVVAAERTSHTIDRSDVECNKLWGFGDGAGALIVSLNRPEKAHAQFNGANFCSKSELNGVVLIKYGGTRYPAAPPGEPPAKRIVHPPTGTDIAKEYRAGYTSAMSAMKKRFHVDPKLLIVNQISPNMVALIAEVAGVSAENTVMTGPDYGHCGSADIILGLNKYLANSSISEPVTLAGSTPYLFGAGLITAP